VLPKGTPLVGGTVVGFLNNYGCYTRGTSALAVSYPNMDIAVGYGRKTKSSPEYASNEYARMIDYKLKSSRYPYNFLLNLISGPELFNLPGMGYKKIIKSKKSANLGIFFAEIMQKIGKKGMPRDDEILKNLTKKMPDYSSLSGVLLDDFKFLDNYQFLNNDVLTGKLVGLGMKTDLSFDVNTTHCMKETGINLEVTKIAYNGWVIKEINNKPAWPEFLRLLDWNEDIILDESKLMERMMYCPLGFKRDGKVYPTITGIVVLGDSMVTAVRTKVGDKAAILNINGKLLVESVKINLEKYQDFKPEFGLFSSCITRLITLGREIYSLRDILLDYFNDKPFLDIYVAGEGTYSSREKRLAYSDMSFNSAIFGSKNNSKI
jgi:hypothetical protein